jgi:hypothetical protein
MVDLAHVHHGRHAGIQLRKPAVELVDIDILRAVVLREAQKHLLVVVPLVLGPSVIDDDRVRQGGAQARFELVVVRVDEARHHDLARGVDHVGVGGVDMVSDLHDLRSFDQHVALGEIAHVRIDRHHHAALDQDARAVLPRKLRDRRRR